MQSLLTNELLLVPHEKPSSSFTERNASLSSVAFNVKHVQEVFGLIERISHQIHLFLPVVFGLDCYL